MSLSIHQELQDYMPAVTSETDGELERQLLAEGGPSEPIVVWKGRDIIVDGHRRYKICQKHDLSFKIRYVEFSDISAVKVWMARWAIARRNLDKLQMTAFIKAMIDGVRATGKLEREAASQVADQLGVSRSTAYRAQETQRKVSSLPEEARQKILSKAVPSTVTDVARLSHMPPEEVNTVVSTAQTEGIALREAIDRHEEEAVLDTAVDSDVSVCDVPNLPTSQLIKAAQKSLGKFIRDLSDLHQVNANPMEYRSCKRSLEAIGLSLQNWLN